ncbi:hypothetical protein SMICM17S_03071 [Streptomyces microflavus]
MLFITPRWRSAIGLGAPVDPEVWMTYARSPGATPLSTSPAGASAHRAASRSSSTIR